MPRAYTITVQPPLAGVSDATGFQNEPPFSSHASTNFWPVDVKTDRKLSATRPALKDLTSPDETIEGLVPINGRATGRPFQSLVAAAAGSLYYWNGSGWLLATGAAAASADTGRPVYGAPYLQHAYFCKEDSAPIDFSYVAGTAEIMTAIAGTVPQDCRIAFTWQGSLCLAGALDDPLVLSMSRTGDAYDWDYTATDEGGAFTSGGESEGLLNGPITAGFAHTSDTAIVSTLGGIVAWRGHPRRGGLPENISSEYILGQGAWCKTPDDHAWFLTPSGLMVLAPQPGAIPVRVSKKKIPAELIALTYDYENPSVAMAYDSRWELIHITDRTAPVAWTFDPQTGGFHEASYSNYPYVMFEHRPFITDDRSGVLFGRSA